jgi:hypothetical protein
MMSARVKLGALVVMLLSGCAKGSTGLGLEGDPVQPDDAGLDAAASEDAGAVEDAGAAEDAGGELDASVEEDAGEPDAGDFCAAITSCAMPTMAGAVRGDTGNDPLNLMGVGNAFVAVYVSEESNLSIPTKVRGTLTSAAGTNFDLLVYAEQDSCSTVSESSTTNFTDIAGASWGDDFASDDARTVVFEVRHVSGECAAAAQWMLEIRGNN